MSKKSFKQDIATGADRFFSALDTQDTGDTADVQDTDGVRDTSDTLDVQDTPATPDSKDRRAARGTSSRSTRAAPADAPAEAAPKATYRINLKLDADHKAFLADEAWRQRISVTELLNRMIAAWREGAGGG